MLEEAVLQGRVGTDFSDRPKRKEFLPIMGKLFFDNP